MAKIFDYIEATVLLPNMVRDLENCLIHKKFSEAERISFEMHSNLSDLLEWFSDQKDNKIAELTFQNTQLSTPTIVKPVEGVGVALNRVSLYEKLPTTTE